MEAGTGAAGGTAVGTMEAIGIVGVGGLATAGVGGAGAAGIPTRPGVNTHMVTTPAATAILLAPKMKPQRFNQGLLTSASITARSTAKLVRRQKVRLKLSRPAAA
jgi:hypothetical protein